MSSAAETASAFTKDNPFHAKVVENRRLNRVGSAKETRHVAISIEGSNLVYKAGDSLGVYPQNRPQDVAEIINLLGANGDEPVSPALLKLPAPVSLHEALLSKLSLTRPTGKILEALAARVTDAGEKTRLAGLLAPEAKEQLAAYLAEREYVDILGEFRSARLAPQEFVDHLRKLMPRLYSIASSSKQHPDEIHLTVAVLRYMMNNRERVGVCSTFLADRAGLGTASVPIFISNSHFAPPQDASKDIIMVGPGTGIAPFRAFMQDRVASQCKGRNWLFFGDQHKNTDFLYELEWQNYLAKGLLSKLTLAWSRDQQQKIYVQDKMRENAAELWEWIKNGAHFYICGDAKRMAKDVEAALLEIIAQQGNMDAAATADYVKELKKDKRYQRDVY
ncbi:sulfite reductase subunit alpha [Ereboglobus luteus]|uniref:assimilatory sulfite reductase (NADPH) n=1 Tax=Ereboglobus luteus TaxID=1796921 RepID=A0A2U8E0I0_9BACT|nr:sulfite reductase subunit alpha [Ereboglobus luteus]AWI08367.1 FAD-binding protein [Ereboglobus luteus]